MNETCAVCKKGKWPEICAICGFTDKGVINREFPIKEDASYWLEAVVKPYRIRWEAKKSEEQLRMQFEELKTKLYKSYREARDTIIDDLQKTKMELEASKEREKKPSQELDQMEAKAEIQPPPLPKIASPKNISPPMPNYSDRTINVGAVIPLVT